MKKIVPLLFKPYKPEDYLETAIKTARFIQRYEVREAVGKSWKIVPDQYGEDESLAVFGSKSFYAGAAGIGFFFLRLFQLTREEEWLREAEAAADYLIANETGLEFYRNIQKLIETDPVKVYGWAFSYKIGPICEGQFAYALYMETGIQKYKEYAIRVTDTFVNAAIETEDGVHWSDARDIVGDAGGIVYLLQMYKAVNDRRYLDTAKEGARYIEKFGHLAKTGGVYYDLYDVNLAGEGEKGTVHVNFSHGSSGIAYLYAVLYEATGEEKYLKLADDIVTYLDGIAVGDEDAVLLPYQDHPVNGATYDRFYLGMCGGPVGTTLPFKKLYDTTKDEKYLDWIKKLANGLVKAGVPESKSWGYWGSKCICCGGPGVLEYFSQLYDYTGNEKYMEYTERTAHVLVRDSVEEAGGISWYGAWDRQHPDVVRNYLGFYIGAAGAAGALLKYYSSMKKQKIADFFEYIL